MIDNEDIVFNTVSEKLRQTYSGIFITGRKMNDTPPKFPAISITSIGNTLVTRYTTFQQIENVVSEAYEFDVNSNLTVGREKECKEIINSVDEVMSELGFIRNFNEPIDGIDKTLSRRIARYTRLSTGG